MSRKPSKKKVLVLNADFIPLHLVPLSTITWQEAICLIYSNKATAIEYYDEEVSSPTISMKVPSVIVLKGYKFFKKHAKLNKYNIKLRDEFTCQYCGEVHSHRSLTIDHVHPKSKGGKTEWSNLVAACKPCNQAKKDHKHMQPKTKPYRPTYFDLAKKLLKYERVTNEHWAQYVKVGNE